MSRSESNIVIITGAHLCHNPRVVKEATTLGEAGYNVTVLRPSIQDDLEEEDARILSGAPFTCKITTDVRPRNRMSSVVGRGVRRMAYEANRRLNLERPEELGYGVRSALGKARAINADYYIGHQEVGAWVCWKLMKDGRAVGADLEDWYSRDLLPENRAGRPVELLDRCEGDLVREARHVTTTSNAMADAMAEAYGRRPEVVYNAFPWADRSLIDGERRDRLPDDRPSLFWFSQTIGPGRGLEELVDALKVLDVPVQLHLRGNVSDEYRSALSQRLGETRHSLLFHDLVPPGELLSRISEHDIGMALELSKPPSRDLTVTNKILQYLLGGLAVVATRTSGQEEVAESAGAAATIIEHTSKSLASAIRPLLQNNNRMAVSKAAALTAAQSVYSWERQAERLVKLIDDVLSATGKEG